MRVDWRGGRAKAAWRGGKQQCFGGEVSGVVVGGVVIGGVVIGPDRAADATTGANAAKARKPVRRSGRKSFGAGRGGPRWLHSGGVKANLLANSRIPVASRATRLKHEAMSEINAPYAQGTPCWIDLMAKDQQAAMDFYADLFGWQGQIGEEQFGGYAVMELRGRAVAGIGPSMAPEGMPEPPHVWTTYLSSDDADATTQRITAAKGNVMVPAMDVGELGRMAIATDPAGAFFGYWQPKEFFGAQIVNEPGALLWSECNVRDVPAASAFYQAAFGIETQPMKGVDNYNVLLVNGKDVGGMQDMSEQFPAEVPAHWMTWFAVDDVDSMVDAHVRAGGTVTIPAMQIPPGRMAGLCDPWGAMFCILKPEPME